jgi:hypothetical protein
VMAVCAEAKSIVNGSDLAESYPNPPAGLKSATR